VIGLSLTIFGLPVLLLLAAMLWYEAKDRHNGTVVVAGKTREYLLHVPESYDERTPTPLVVSMHASGLWPAAQRGVSGWNELADQEGFIVVYPSGLPLFGHWVKIWRLWPNMTGSDERADEVQFIAELIDSLAVTYNIDRARIYANGYSSGAGMVNVLACQLPNRFAAVGTVAAAHMPWSGCDRFTPIPLIAFHGTADLTVPYAGGSSTHWTSPPGATWDSIEGWTSGWAQKNGCDGSPIETPVAVDVKLREYLHCVSDAEVVLYTIEGGGHAWPGRPSPEWLLGHVTDSIDATRETWAFFRKHRLEVKQ
jgi:polyhydroxybutyrate depolymerase